MVIRFSMPGYELAAVSFFLDLRSSDAALIFAAAFSLIVG
jgi:hypothetical protein